MEQQGRILDGDLETLGLSAALKMLALSGKTGVLNVVSGQERLAVFLENGHIIDLEEPGASTPDLVDMLRLMGVISRDHAAEVRRLSGGDSRTAMTIMAQWGLLAPAEMQQRTEFRVIQSISRAINWTRGRFEFHRDVASIQMRSGILRPLNVDHILLEALRMADEWGRDGSHGYSRGTMARWMPEFDGDVRQLGLGREEIGVLCLSNGQFPLHAISYALLIPEPQVVLIMQRLVELGLVEVVDARLEDELERSLVNLLTQSQHQLSQESGPAPEQRMLTIIRTMGTFINGVIAHHAIYARSLRGRGEIPRRELVRYLEATFGPIIQQLQINFPRMDGIVRFANGEINFEDLETLDKVVRGQELADSYWDAAQFVSQLMQMLFDRILYDEIGKSPTGQRFEDLWKVFQRELDIDMTRLAQRRAASRGQAEKTVQSRSAGRGGHRGVEYAYDAAPDVWRSNR
ncbi:MAG: DUF4388 domain-containing protein [Ktedonobacterales bacterium]